MLKFATVKVQEPRLANFCKAQEPRLPPGVDLPLQGRRVQVRLREAILARTVHDGAVRNADVQQRAAMPQ